MKNSDNIKSILEKIDELKKDLYSEYSNLQKKYEYFFAKRKVIFSKEAKIRQKVEKINLLRYIFGVNMRHFFSMPFIYSMIIPGVFLDIFLTIYQHTALPLYKIPRVKRSDFFIYDRRFLGYLNILQKLNCLYCSYMNGLFAYAVEIAGRTEQYWCPIKHAMLSDTEHRYFKEFADFGNEKDFNDMINSNICFNQKG